VTLRVLDVTSFFSATCGGIKTYYREKASRLPARGVDCHFAVPGARRESRAFHGGQLHAIPGPRMPGNPDYRAFGHLAALWQLVDELAPDIVELGSHYLLPDLLRIGVARRSARHQPRWVGFYHADYPTTYVEPALALAPRAVRARATSAAWSWVRRQHRRYDLTLAGSRHTARALADHGVPRVRWVGLGVDTEVFRPHARMAGRAPVVVYAGRLAAEKGVHTLFAAFPAIHRETGAKLRVAGAGPLTPRLRELAARWPAVTELGYLANPAALAAVVADADLVVAPGAHESFSFAAAEALACGVPVVAADRAGNRELIEASQAGAVFRHGDQRALAEACVRLLSATPVERRELGEAGRSYVHSELSWPQVLARLSAAYEEVRTCSSRPSTM
jgi:alpha-1,6-mannosyltransferase